MADITDTNNSRGRLDAEWENLDQADIDNRDRTAIRRFVVKRATSDNRPFSASYCRVESLEIQSE